MDEATKAPLLHSIRTYVTIQPTKQIHARPPANRASSPNIVCCKISTKSTKIPQEGGVKADKADIFTKHLAKYPPPAAQRKSEQQCHRRPSLRENKRSPKPNRKQPWPHHRFAATFPFQPTSGTLPHWKSWRARRTYNQSRACRRFWGRGRVTWMTASRRQLTSCDILPARRIGNHLARCLLHQQMEM